jgi:protoporphyrinogen oxidase
VAALVLEEIVNGRAAGEVVTMADWLRASFGPTLCEMFFEPFHELYTAGLFREIAPQDAYKTPVNPSLVIRGAFEDVPQVGYNVTFVYPVEGLNVLARRMAEQCRVHYSKRVVHIDVHAREVHFEDGTSERYNELISTLPLNRMMEMTGLDVGERPDPATSVLVVNIGAVRGPNCPEEHWLYIPRSRAGFHRVGFYSNVDPSFLPASARERGDRVSIYVEKAYREGQRPNDAEWERISWTIVQELQDWGWIKEAEVVDPTWIEVAYTWSWPGSKWRTKALKTLQDHGIYQVGRYARWVFQGIADSIRDGLAVIA